MGACIAANQDKDDPAAWCAAVMRNTEDQCAKVARIEYGPAALVKQALTVPQSAVWQAFGMVGSDVAALAEDLVLQATRDFSAGVAVEAGRAGYALTGDVAVTDSPGLSGLRVPAALASR